MGLSWQFFTGIFNGSKVFFESDTTKYELGCMSIVKNQSNWMTFFCEVPILAPYKKKCSNLSINK